MSPVSSRSTDQRVLFHPRRRFPASRAVAFFLPSNVFSDDDDEYLAVQLDGRHVSKGSDVQKVAMYFVGPLRHGLDVGANFHSRPTRTGHAPPQAISSGSILGVPCPFDQGMIMAPLNHFGAQWVDRRSYTQLQIHSSNTAFLTAQTFSGA